MKIEIDLPWVGESDADEAIIAETGRALAARLYNETVIPNSYQMLSKALAQEAVDAVRQRIQPIIEEAIVGPFPKTNAYGEQSGGSTTLRELIIAEARAWLTKGDRYSSGSQTNLQKLIAEEVDRRIKKELGEAIAAAKAEVDAAVRAKGAEVLAETIKRLALSQ